MTKSKTPVIGNLVYLYYEDRLEILISALVDEYSYKGKLPLGN